MFKTISKIECELTGHFIFVSFLFAGKLDEEHVFSWICGSPFILNRRATIKRLGCVVLLCNILLNGRLYVFLTTPS